MTATQWIGVAILALLFAFAAFAFRKGFAVKPDGNAPDSSQGGSPPGGYHGGHTDSH
jgi:hypothetical protein